MSYDVVLVAGISALPATLSVLAGFRTRAKVKQVSNQVTTANGGLTLADLMVKVEEASRAPITEVRWWLYAGDKKLPVTIRPEPIHPSE